MLTIERHKYRHPRRVGASNVVWQAAYRICFHGSNAGLNVTKSSCPCAINHEQPCDNNLTHAERALGITTED